MGYEAVIAAAGSGRRFGGKKQFAELNGRAVLWHALQAFVDHPDVRSIYVVVNAEDARLAQDIVAGLPGHIHVLSEGGATRAETVMNGLRHCDDAGEALIHDAARPCLSAESLSRLLQAECEDGALLALPVGDALKEESADGDKRVQNNISRRGVWAAQTPQRYPAQILKDALPRCPDALDEAEAVRRAGRSPLLVEGDCRNIKITRDRDLWMAAQILSGMAARRQ